MSSSLYMLHHPLTLTSVSPSPYMLHHPLTLTSVSPSPYMLQFSCAYWEQLNNISSSSTHCLLCVVTPSLVLWNTWQTDDMHENSAVLLRDFYFLVKLNIVGCLFLHESIIMLFLQANVDILIWEIDIK